MASGQSSDTSCGVLRVSSSQSGDVYKHEMTVGASSDTQLKVSFVQR